ncbi:MAG: ABC transporter permease [Verrucomicrobia bacterium]|nr:ABC transporter permease [Verrucomicrobiota bacterium]MBI3868740.1 ABC transporter permease [Verrucomicrobiota bacterium]
MSAATPSPPGHGNVDAVPRSPGQIFRERLRRKKIAMVGAAILAILYTLSLFAGFFAPYPYDRIDKERSFHRPTGLCFQGGRLSVRLYKKVAEPATYEASADGSAAALRFFAKGEPYTLFGFLKCSTHFLGVDHPDAPLFLLGADQFGRDILSRLLYGSQISLSIGLIGITLSLSLGMLIGGYAGYVGGGVDFTVMRVCELIMSIPGLYLIMALRSVFPASLSSTLVYIIIVAILSFIRWASSARVVRGMALSLRERPFVLAARALGQTRVRIVLKHILPSTFSYVIVAATLSVPYYILGEVVMSYLNVGIQEPEASWGLMLNAAQNHQYVQDYPWLLAPGGAIFLTVLAFNFLGDGLRDAADTKSA